MDGGRGYKLKGASDRIHHSPSAYLLTISAISLPCRLYVSAPISVHGTYKQ